MVSELNFGFLGIYLEVERIRTFGAELSMTGDFISLVLVFDEILQNANQRFPHVSVQGITDEHETLLPQSLQQVSRIQPEKMKSNNRNDESNQSSLK